MSDADQTPGGPEAAPAPPPRRISPWTAALPYVATAVVAILCSLALQALIRPAAPLADPTATASATAAPVAATPAAVQTPQRDVSAPNPTPPAADERVLRLEILDLEDADRRLWSSLYLLRAASQLDDAAGALQTNSVDEADRSLLAARRSLDRAYDFSAEQAKGPIDTFRIQLGQIRDDLRLRPENLDRRLRQIRQLVLSLVDAGGA